MTAKKATAAELREELLDDITNADGPLHDVIVTEQVDDLLAAARAEAVAPVLDVLQQLVAVMPRCRFVGCTSVGIVLDEDSRAVCVEHASRFEPGELHDHARSDALRAALALLAADQSGAKAGKP